MKNPDLDITNFDNLFNSMLMVFVCMTLEGWSSIMAMVVKVMSPYVIIYFVIVVFVGTYFLVNLTIAVITIKFEEAHNLSTD